MTNTDISKRDIDLLLSLLRKIKPGYFPHELFVEFYRLNKLTAFELVPIVRYPADLIKVILVKRPVNDPFWPGRYNLPGSVVRSLDTEESVLKRLLSEELGNPKIITVPKFSHFEFVETKRGRGIALVYWIEVQHDTCKGESFEIENLPKKILKNHIPTIQRIARSLN